MERGEICTGQVILQPISLESDRLLDLPRKNLTSDGEIIARARQDGRVVVSKDADFAQSFLITGEPSLLLISTGNINNAGLEKILRANLSRIEAAFDSSRFVEITRDALVIHE